MTTTLPECMIDSQSLKSSPAVLPFSSNLLAELWCGWSFPSTSSMEYKMPESPKWIEHYSLPNGWGLWCTNIQPGQVHWLVHTDTDSSRQATHEGTKALCVCLLKAFINSSTQWKGDLYAGARVEVNFRYFMMVSKHLWDIKWLKQKGAPKKCQHLLLTRIPSLSTLVLFLSVAWVQETLWTHKTGREEQSAGSFAPEGPLWWRQLVENAGSAPRCYFLLPYQSLTIQPFNYSSYWSSWDLMCCFPSPK